MTEFSATQPLSQGRIYGIPVQVTDIINEAEGVISIVMKHDEGGRFPEWTPGAHVDLVIDDKSELVRQYSLCGDPADRETLKVAVLREPQSRGGSEALHTKLRVGDKLTIKGPRNAFPMEQAAEYIFIAGGIGITPIIPMINAVEKTGKPWKLIYGGRSRRSMAFIDALSAYGSKVEFCPEDEIGLIDLQKWLGTPREKCLVYSCGPERLLQAVEEKCASWPDGALHLERFKPVEVISEVEDAPFEVVLQQSGVTIQVDSNESIANAVEKAGFYIPRSCDEGTCGTCMTRVIEGTPDHRDSFLRGKMRDENKFIMVCCSRSKSPKLVLDA